MKSLTRPLKPAATPPLRPLTAKTIKGFCIRSRLILRRLLVGTTTRTELDSLIESSCSPNYINLMRAKGVAIHTSSYHHVDRHGIEGYRGKYYLGWQSRGLVIAALGGAA